MTGSIRPPEVPIPPLGSKPQLVTLVIIHLLLEREATLEEVIVIHQRPADRAVTGDRVRWHGVARKGEARRCGVAHAIGRFLRRASPLHSLTVAIIDGRRAAVVERDCA